MLKLSNESENFAQRLKVNKIDYKKVSSLTNFGKWGFWNPYFKTDCRDIYMYIYINISFTKT